MACYILKSSVLQYLRLNVFYILYDFLWQEKFPVFSIKSFSNIVLTLGHPFAILCRQKTGIL
jgi:hypothetical protein